MTGVLGFQCRLKMPIFFLEVDPVALLFKSSTYCLKDFCTHLNVMVHALGTSDFQEKYGVCRFLLKSIVEQSDIIHWIGSCIRPSCSPSLTASADFSIRLDTCSPSHSCKLHINAQ